MVAFRSGVVREVIDERAGLQKIRVDIDGAAARAYVLTDLIGVVAVGDEVVCNTTAVELDLGTGGWHFVHWNLARRSFEQRGRGHIMKLRYTSLQADTGSTEEREPALAAVASTPGLVVVGASLHSQVAGIAVAVRRAAPNARIAYVMTDGAALPLALSDLVAALRSAGQIDVTITCGHAFGGDHEAVSLASALAIAHVIESVDVAIVAMGPGIVGTGTALGTTAIELATVIDTAGALGARVVVAPRGSDGDARDRHQGVSHHTTTALALAARPALIATPAHRPDVAASLAADERLRHHRVLSVRIEDIASQFAALGLDVRSMGRAAADDPLPHECAAAAGHAAMAS